MTWNTEEAKINLIWLKEVRRNKNKLHHILKFPCEHRGKNAFLYGEILHYFHKLIVHCHYTQHCFSEHLLFSLLRDKFHSFNIECSSTEVNIIGTSENLGISAPKQRFL
uniref:Uncharacterized protein n=1 Tax=Micrurus spixii TaxID=129469 RepID=A0A2D4LFA7_9SAUR